VDVDRWQRVKEVFAGALERPDRSAYLERACRDDPELRSEVDSLLAAHAATDGFIEKPAAARLEPAPAPTWIGRRLGAYRIVGELGSGGMSEVFRAVRADDEYHKEVAVKILRPGYDTQFLLERFKSEKRILAALDHPNIARILDGGSTDEGLPYLVMDFIKGQPIDQYCREHDLSQRQRLELFQTLCCAVQYVHQHLMVHADLKCNNILVTDDGSVRLLDFGVSELVQAPSRHALLAFTPEYASPEQLRGDVVSTASDVYSLGVVLHRLLTGELPGAGIYPVADLDAIIRTALRQEPAQRYSSVEQFRLDIARYLRGFPVSCRPATVPYTLFKFCGRHRTGIAILGAFVLCLIGGIVAASWEAHVARQERARAERHFADVRRLASTFMFDLHESIQNLPGSTQTRHLLVLNSLKYLDGLAAESAGDVTLRRELATAYEKVADVQGGYRQANLGESAGAIQSYRKALAIRLALPQDRDLQREVLRNYGKLGEVLAGSGDSAGAIANSRIAVALAERLAAEPGATSQDRRNLGSVYVSLGWQLARSGETTRGLMLMNQGTAVFESLVDADATDSRSRHHAAVAYGRMGEILIGEQRYDDALAFHSKQQQFAHALAVSDPTNAELRTLESYALLGIASVLSKRGASQEALSKQTEASNTLRALFDADARDTEARYNAAFALSEVSATLAALGQFQAAELKLRDALAIIEPLAGTDDPAMENARALQTTATTRLENIAARRQSSH
jgi:non-specific serine/threonine protein kinase/serine/threonine-protein kinase